MGHCSECGIEQKFPFECVTCGRTFCADHKYPENHSCSIKKSTPFQNNCQNYKKTAEQTENKTNVCVIPQPSPSSRTEFTEGNGVTPKTLGGKYEIYGELGEGGFGKVYLIYSRRFGRMSALKTLRDELLQDKGCSELFRKEATVWTKLGNHAYIVRAFLVDEVSGQLYIEMEYIAKNEHGLNSLEDYLNVQPPDLKQSLHWSIQFCVGMEYAYSQGLRCHRDIKPSNIMITKEKDVKITDFGIASAIGLEKVNGAKINVNQGRVGLSASRIEGEGFGTPTHMPPEQFIKTALCDQRSDIYAFGVVLFQMATRGKLPFLGTMPKDGSVEEQSRFWKEMFNLHMHTFVPFLNSPLFKIIRKCLEKDPDKRFQGFKEVRGELEILLKDHTGEVVKMSSLQSKPQNLELLNKGFGLDTLGYFDEAIECYNQALRINPLNAEVWMNKGISFTKLRSFNQALQCFDESLKINPQNPKTWLNRGILLFEMGQINEALACVDKALAIDPLYENGWFNKASFLGKLGRFEEAVHYYDEALRIEPQDEEAWMSKGICLHNLNHLVQAVDSFEEVLKIKPSHGGACYNLAFILDKLNRKTEAIQAYRKFISLSPSQYANQIIDAKNRLRELDRSENRGFSGIV